MCCLIKVLLSVKCFWDIDGNRVQDRSEQGIGGIRIATEYGVVIETDEDGKYHIADVPAGRHLLKIMPDSIPEGLKDLAGGEIGYSTENPYLVKITPGLLAKVNFGLALEEGPPQISPTGKSKRGGSSLRSEESKQGGSSVDKSTSEGGLASLKKLKEQFFIVMLAEGEVKHLDTSGNIDMINKDDRYDKRIQGRW